MAGAADTTAVDVVAILDSGSGVTTMSVGIMNKLQAAFPDVQVGGGMSHPGSIKLAESRVLVVEQKTCPVRIARRPSLNSHENRRGTHNVIPFCCFSCVCTPRFNPSLRSFDLTN